MNGFSYVELLFTVLAISVLAGITFPPVKALREGLALRGAVDEFVMAHNLARTVAIRSSRVSELHIEPDSGTFWVQVDSSLAGSGAMDTIGIIVRLSDLNVSIGSNRSVLCFDGRGLAYSLGDCDGIQSAVVTFTGGTKADTVRRTAVGLVR